MNRAWLLKAIEEQIGCALIRAGIPVEQVDNEVEEFRVRLRSTETRILREIYERGCVQEAETMAAE